MRQTLMRIVPELWAWQTSPGQWLVGCGYMALAWTMCVLLWVGWRTLRHRGHLRDSLQHAALTWLLVTTALVMLPRLISGGIPIFGYGFMLFLGFIAACASASHRARLVGLSPELGWDLGMWIFFGGILGARIWYLVQKHDQVFAGKRGVKLLQAAVNLSDGGLVLYGGVILGTVAFAVYCLRRKFSMLLIGDIAMPSIFIGLAFGRFGCFLNGCCYGDRCSLPWAVTFPAGSVPYRALVARGFLPPDATASLPLHPTQLYSVINALILAGITAAYFRYRPRNGAVLAVGFIIYPITRIIIELLRGDELGQFGTGLTISQLFSIVLSIASLAYLLYLLFAPERSEQNAASSGL